MLKRISDLLNKDTKRGIRFLVLILSGILTGLTVAFPTIGFLEWITIAPALVILLRRGSDKTVKLKSPPGTELSPPFFPSSCPRGQPTNTWAPAQA